jgi:hypothetical protein
MQNKRVLHGCVAPVPIVAQPYWTSSIYFVENVEHSGSDATVENIWYKSEGTLDLTKVMVPP